MKAFLVAMIALASGLLWGGCGPRSGSDAEKPEMHQNVAPHGGTPVALGDDYNLELVRDPAEGTLSAYVLDDEMEDFIRCGDPSVTLSVKAGGEERTLVLPAIANSATGERVGATSLFQTQADWLKTTGNFTGVIQSITIRGTPFTAVPFTFPSGNTKE